MGIPRGLWILNRTLWLVVAIAAVQLSWAEGPVPHAFFRVQVATTVGAPVSGRLLIFLKKGTGDKEVAVSEFHPGDTWVAAREVHDLAPGATVEFDADEVAYPKPFSALPAGVYEAQAVLDVDHNYNYRERVPQDWIGPVATLAGWKAGSAEEPVLTIDRHPEENPQRAEAMAKLRVAALPTWRNWWSSIARC